MNRIESLVYGLDHLDYDLVAAAARAKGLKKRIVSEFILHEPLPTWGKPPVVLSKPLTEAQVNELLIGLAQHIESCLDFAKQLKIKEKT